MLYKGVDKYTNVDCAVSALLEDLNRLEEEMEALGYAPDTLEEKDEEFGSLLELNRDRLETAAMCLEAEISQNECIRNIAFIPVEKLNDFEEEELRDIYKKVRVLGKLLVELEKYALAEPYLFVAYKINQFYNQKEESSLPYDTNVLLCLAETLYMNAEHDDNGPVEEHIERYIKEFRNHLHHRIFGDVTKSAEEKQDASVMPLSYRRLLEASGLLFIVIAQNPEDNSAHEMMAQVQWALAKEYIRLARDIHNKNLFTLNERDIAQIQFSYEEARRYARKAALSVSDESSPDYELYAAITREYAKFLMNANYATEGGKLIQEMITNDIEPLKAVISGVEALIPFIEENRIRRNEFFQIDEACKEYRSAQNQYLRLKQTAITYLNIVVERADQSDPEDKDLLFQAYYWLGIIAAGDMSTETAQDYLGLMAKLFNSDNEEYKPYFEALGEKISENSFWKV